jgi:hypothetical protein
MQTAMAQSNAAGSIYGRVDSAAGATVNLVNTETGLRRTATADATGRFQATALPLGHYRVELVRNGAVERTVEVDVIAGQGVDASFAAAASGVQSVRVTGRRNRIDVTNTNNGSTFTAKELASLPIARNVDAIIQLAPNTTRADPRYAGGASLGGGGPSESAYYINGFPVTNPLTQLGGAELPFGAIAQASILTGGFGAEFGRSVGGIVNITTKSGTNNWEAGVMASIEPDRWRAREKNLTYGNTGKNPATDNQLRRRDEGNTLTEKIFGAYVGGPIIKDKLFLFAAVEEQRQDRGFVNLTTVAITPASTLLPSGWTDRNKKVRRHFEKIDWNITDNHRLEFSSIGDQTRRDDSLMGYDYATGQTNGKVVSGQHYTNPTDSGNSIKAQVLRYVGNLTDDITLTLLTGRSKTPHTNLYDGYDPTQKLYQVSQVTGTAGSGFAPGLNYTSPQFLTGNIIAPGAEDQIKSNRVDLEWKLGRHTLRAGLDDNKLTSLNAGDITAGGGAWSYRRGVVGNTATLNTEKVVIGAGAAPGSLAAQGYYVREAILNTATNTYSNQSAQFIEDRFQVTPNILVTGGVRIEQMENLNGDEQTFLEVKNQIAPRLSASWDVFGDASFKVYGSAGRYSLQIPTHISVRGASRSLNTTQFFTYTGTDANGNPTGLKPLTSAPYSANNEYYQAKDPLAVTAVDIKPTYQDELTLGFEKAYSPNLNFGAKVTYRKLRQTIDDFCDGSIIDAWAERNNVSTANYDGFGCASFNPGEDNTFLVDFNNADPAQAGKTHTSVSLSAEEMGFPKTKRTYTAVDLFAEHPYRNGWYGRVNYTWSRSYGNTEGQTLSDVGQTDVAATQTWDFPEIMEYAEGLLPSNRTHQIKAFAYYDVTPEWIVGGNFLAASGRPKSCLGEYVRADGSLTTFGYGSSFHYCDFKPAPRGGAGRLPWDVRFDANLAYKPAFLKGLAVKLDVFNMFNKRTAQAVDEQYTDGSATNTVAATYGRVLYWTAPRSVRLGAEYNIKF